MVLCLDNSLTAMSSLRTNTNTKWHLKNCGYKAKLFHKSRDETANVRNRNNRATKIL